ncbi:MAG: SusC/RagA family TonB-linked outer membrane protein [Candidatus Cryptobacteroides sp.]
MKLKLIRRAALSVIVLVVLFGSSPLIAQTPQISLDKNNVQMKDVMAEIESQSNYLFVYQDDCDLSRTVSLKVASKPVDQVLSQLFKDSGITYRIDGSNIILSKEAKPAQAAPKSKRELFVTGKVVDENKAPLAGATVWVKETSISFITDSEGKYSLNVTGLAAPVISVSFFGYEDAMEVVNGRNVVNFQMRPSSFVLEDAVAVAYGTQRRESVIGSISQVTPVELRSPTANISTALAGQVSGLVSIQRSGEPGESSNFWIRGISSLNSASRAPLVLVDGIERSMDLVDVEDIESFSVLKDATATAVYGVKGANGVILINTRSGQQGAPKIGIRVEQGMVSPTQMPKFVDGVTFANMYNEASGYEYFSQEYIQKTADGSDPDLYPNVDWLKVLYKDVASNTRVTANVSGGGSVAKYYVSGGYYHEGSIYNVDNTNQYNTSIRYNKFNFRSNVDINITRTTVLNLNLSNVFETKIRPGSDKNDIWVSSFQTSPIAFPPYFSDGRHSTSPQGDQNPYNVLTQNGFGKDFTNNAQALIGLTQDFDDWVPGLKANVKFSWDAVTTQSQTFRGVPEQYTVAGRDDDGNLMLNLVKEGQNSLTYSKSSSAQRTTYLEGSLTYERTFASRHRLGAMFLYNQSQKVVMLSGDIYGAIPYRSQGIAGRLTYSYDDRYFLEGNVGYNGSENFSPGNRFGLFPAGAFGWMLSNEKFFEPLSKVFNVFKIRASYGIVGNDKIGANRRFIYNGTFATTGNAYQFGSGNNKQGYTAIYRGDIENPNVSWEKSYKLDVGLEMELFRTVKIQADYFRDHRTGIFVQMNNISDINGIGSLPYTNIGETLNRGFEGMLEANRRFGDWNVSLRGNFTYSRNKVLVNAEPTPAYPWMTNINLPINQQKGFVALGLFESQEEIDNAPTQYGTLRVGDVRYLDVNGDGTINDYDRVPIGRTWLPELTYGFGGSVSWKGVTLSVLFQGVGNTTIQLSGNSVYVFNHAGYYVGGFYQYVYDNMWREGQESPDMLFPRATIGENVNNNKMSTLYTKDVSYLRLKNATIGYTLPKSWAKKVKMRNIYVYCNGLNLLTFSGFKMFDPEIDNQQGAKYPPTRQINFGLNLQF